MNYKLLFLGLLLLLFTSQAFADTTPPVTTFSSFQVPNTTDQNITLTCTDNNSGCKTINYKINNGEWTEIFHFNLLDNNLFAWYKLDESNGTIANNYVSGGDNLTNVGTADINQTGKINTAYNFDGTNDYLKNDTFFTGHQSELTFSAWVYPDSFGADKTIFSFRRDADTWDIFSLHHQNSTNSLVFVGSYGSTHETYNSGYTLPTGQWSHVVLQVKDANCVQIWVNNDRKMNTCNNRTFNNSMTRFYPASYAWNNGGLYYMWDGKLDEIGVWNRILSSSEIESLYNSGIGKNPPFTGFDNNTYSFLYSGAGSHSIQYFSTDNSDNNETIKTSTFTTYGTGHFTFYDENTYAAINSVDYNISPSINGISLGTTTGNKLDLNFQEITSGTYQFTFSKTGYGTRHYYTTINNFTDFNLQYVLLPDTNGSNLSLTIYNSTGTTLLQNTPVTITKNNYTVGKYLIDSLGIITPFIKANDTNYLFSIEGYYTTSQRIVIINRPIWDTNLGLISGTWQVTLTSPQSTTRYTITTNNQAIGILPNTTIEYIANVCMYSGSTCDPNFIQRNYLLYFKGLIGETLIQPYMNLVSSSTQRTLKVLNYTTNQPYPLTQISIYTKTQNGVNYLVESLVTDSTGIASTYLNNLQQYTIITNNATYTIVPNADNFTYYIYVNFLTLDTPDYTSSDTNTQSDVNAPLDEFYNLRNTLFNTCTLKNDCFPAALIAIIITLIVLIVITSMALNNFIGIKGLSLVAFICLTIFFGIGWLPIYVYAFLGTISLLLLVIVQ